MLQLYVNIVFYIPRNGVELEHHPVYLYICEFVHFSIIKLFYELIFINFTFAIFSSKFV